MNLYVVAAAFSIATWVVLAFVLAIPSGWVHVPLGAGCALLARGLMGTGARKPGKTP